MCGRFTLKTPAKDIAAAFVLAGELPLLKPRYNIAPTQTILTISLQDGYRTPVLRRWGLIPSWAKDTKIGNSLINARADGVADKPSFRSAFKRSRCLVVADGFYEWKATGKAKQPYLFQMADGRPFAFAGLAEHWSKGEKPIDSATIITGEPNVLTGDVHDRMPVILAPSDYDVWLDPEFQDKDKLLALLRPYPAEEMKAFPVSTTVNSPRNDTPECVEPFP
jgi:putative SOS response-associated peptidase YedK